MSSYVVRAEQAARQDGERLYVSVSALKQAGFEGRYCVVDGTAFSPSWRALWGGSEAWALAGTRVEREGTGPPHSWDLGDEVQGAYEEALDRVTEELGLFWEEGCLWYASDGWLEAELLAERGEAREESERAQREAGAEYGRRAQGLTESEQEARREAEAAGLDWGEQERLRRALALRLAPSPHAALAERVGRKGDGS